MSDVVHWWLTADVIGVIALPYAFRFFRFLPDRGIAFAKPLGLLLAGYILWIGAFARVLPNGGGSAALVLALLAAGALWIAGRDRAALIPEIRARVRLILVVEALFLLFFVGAAVLRAYAPNIDATEKPFESAFFQSVLRSDPFGPRDPWYGGAPMSYYYFGYVLIGVVTHLTATAPEVAFNLGLALIAGMAASAAFGMVYNLVAIRGCGRPRPAILLALLGPLFLLIVSNLEGVFELLAARGVDAGWLYRAVAIENLPGPKASTAWYPTEHWWWWRATRLGSSWNVEEFPFFSFLLGDLHAHVMVLPFSLLMLAAVLHLWRIGETLDGRFLRRHPVFVVGVALLAGNLYVTNAWDFPTALLLLALIVLARNVTAAGSIGFRPIVNSAIFVAAIAILAVLLYLPFYIGFTAAPTQIRVTEVLYGDAFIERQAMATAPVQFLIFWGPLLFPALSYLIWRVRALQPWRLDPTAITLAVVVATAPAFLWACAVIGLRGFAGLFDELQARGHLTITWLILIALVALSALVLLAEVFRTKGQTAEGSRIFIAAGMLTAFLLIIVPEHFFIVDIVVNSRHNTVFKFYYTAWLLLSVTGAAGIADILLARRAPQASAARARGGSRRATVARLGRVAWASVGLTLLTLALVYPVTATLARSDRFRAEATLDGLRGLRRAAPDDYYAAMWLREVARGLPAGDLPVVLEAEGAEYSVAARVSARTGLPTVIGWPNHEWQERGALGPVLARVRDVEALYRTDDATLARTLLDRYKVAYVYVGNFERERYGSAAGDTIARIARLVFDAPSVQIYAVERPEQESARLR